MAHKKRKITVHLDSGIESEAAELEVVEDLGYQIGIGEYVVHVKLPDGKHAAFRSPRKNGVYRRHYPLILPRSKITGQ